MNCQVARVRREVIEKSFIVHCHDNELVNDPHITTHPHPHPCISCTPTFSHMHATLSHLPLTHSYPHTVTHAPHILTHSHSYNTHTHRQPYSYPHAITHAPLTFSHTTHPHTTLTSHTSTTDLVVKPRNTFTATNSSRLQISQTLYQR